MVILGILGLVRYSKGALLLDAYAILSRPFWPGFAQKEWLISGYEFEQQARILLLEEDNQRLREMLSLKNSSDNSLLSAAVISRSPKGWWQKLELGQGGLGGIELGDAVIAPGGLLGTINSVTPTTSRVRLLTSPFSRVGVWVPRIKRHGILIGLGTSRPKLTFIGQDLNAVPGDLISTSPASTLLPPNLPVGLIYSLDKSKTLATHAVVQLSAAPEAIDWVQVKVR